MQISIEVSAVRPEPGATDHLQTCNDAPETADRFAVYIRNPLALHVQDFPVDLTAGRTVADCYSVALRDAFIWADTLGEHLAAPVESKLRRPFPARELSPQDHAETAACLWEAVLELKDEQTRDGRAVAACFSAWGAAEMRSAICALAPEADACWREAVALGFDAPFDWEFCPAFVRAGLFWDDLCPSSGPTHRDRAPVFAALGLNANGER